ncbi:hypothetical protein E2C01_097379 [Portunus trituberculatus]|uniref:Uncharacterized protein n=1 Tax=Portunus trituberculatus TaxID=210409 RepID=A0A5B7K5J6_PORTR|nr:hypothetical protein [Portunus trituberculatus]
MVPLYHGG